MSVEVGDRVVALQEGGVGLARLGVREQDAAPQARVAGEVAAPVRVAVVHEEDDLAPGLAERRPPVLEHRLLERGPRAPDDVGGDHPVGREDRADLRVQPVQGGLVERRRIDEVDVADVQWRVLELEQDRNGGVPAVLVGPALHRPEAVLQGEAVRVVVDVLDVQHLHARRCSSWARAGRRRSPAGGAGRRRGRPRDRRRRRARSGAPPAGRTAPPSGSWAYSRPFSSSPIALRRTSRSSCVASRW